MIEDFFHLPPVSKTRVVHLELRISPRIFEKFETALMIYSRAWGKLVHEKNHVVESLLMSRESREKKTKCG
jgi:hypothetical protein